MNEQRNFVVNQMYIKTEDFCAAHGLDKMPTPEQLKAVVMREVPLEDLAQDASAQEKAAREEIKLHSSLYTEKLLPCVAGASSWFRESIRHNQLISVAKWKGKLCVPPGSEAMTLLIYENSYTRWNLCFQPGNNDCGRKKWTAPKSSKDSETKKFATKYSNSKVGNAKYGGWSNAGRRRYNALKLEVQDARAKPNAQDAEQQMLKWMLQYCGKEDHQPDPDAVNKKKKKGKRSYDDLVDCD
eukprot:Sro1299_g260681.1  (241) ;mRNA; r:13605-14327